MGLYNSGELSSNEIIRPTTSFNSLQDILQKSSFRGYLNLAKSASRRANP
jgi:hypothetical protein